jgi:hypothetical protein
MDIEARRASEWIIHDERVVDDTRRAVLSVADVELPDGVRFEQYVLRIPAAVMVVVLDDADRVLMMWRHRHQRWGNRRRRIRVRLARGVARQGDR